MCFLRTLHATSLPPLITHCSQLKNMSLLFFCQKISQLTAYRSSLKSRCRFPSLQTADVCGTLEYHGFKNPRLFALSGIASFRRHYLLYIITEKRKRLEDGNMNSRGLSSLRFIMSVYKWRLKDGNRKRRLFKTIFVKRSLLTIH